MCLRAGHAIDGPREDKGHNENAGTAKGSRQNISKLQRLITFEPVDGFEQTKKGREGGFSKLSNGLPGALAAPPRHSKATRNAIER